MGFLAKYESHLQSPDATYEFDEEFDRLALQAETMHSQEKYLNNRGINSPNVGHNRPTQITTVESSEKLSEEPVETLDTEGIKARLQSKREGKKVQPATSPNPANPSTSKRVKENRVWGGGSGGKLSAKQAAALDRSGDAVTNEAKEQRELDLNKSIYLPDAGERPLWEIEQEESSRIEEALNTDSETHSKGLWKTLQTSYIGSMIQTITGGKVLDENDLKPILEEMKEMLQSKNVAQEIADDICDSVGKALIGHRMASFTAIRTVVLKALQDAVQRILTPGISIDVLRQVLDAKAAGKIFTTVFVGINGVGKSTSLAKIAYYLKQHGVRVILAACDTFRSGAVEQLRTHAKCLDVPLFEMGYSRDPSSVAAAAIVFAKENHFDCVLVDTAGRMQNNEPLMKALAKLVSENSPDLVLFVGEALVGNDGIDQLSMFDRSLKSYGTSERNTGINGIVLTKFDTIDDKVGAALSMSYKSGQPVTFVGTGQKYTHLKRLNVNTIIHHLFST